MANPKDLTGVRAGRLVALELLPKRRKGCRIWRCLCDCGAEAFVSTHDFGKSARSCGCLRRDLLTKHGDIDSQEYRSWTSMKARCGNPRTAGFHNYGGRGIRVCERWKDYANFLADMGRRPTPRHTLDRIDNNGDYEPGNVRWVTRRQQALNRRDNRVLTWRGKTQTLMEWSEKTGIPYGTLWFRLGTMGLTIGEAIQFRKGSRSPRRGVVTVNGETKSVSEWAKGLGITLASLCYRLDNGWPPELAVTAPKGSRLKMLAKI